MHKVRVGSLEWRVIWNMASVLSTEQVLVNVREGFNHYMCTYQW